MALSPHHFSPTIIINNNYNGNVSIQTTPKKDEAMEALKAENALLKKQLALFTNKSLVAVTNRSSNIAQR